MLQTPHCVVGKIVKSLDFLKVLTLTQAFYHWTLIWNMYMYIKFRLDRNVCRSFEVGWLHDLVFFLYPGWFSDVRVMLLSENIVWTQFKHWARLFVENASTCSGCKSTELLKMLLKFHKSANTINLPKVGIKTLKSNHAGIFLLLPGLWRCEGPQCCPWRWLCSRQSPCILQLSSYLVSPTNIKSHEKRKEKNKFIFCR